MHWQQLSDNLFGCPYNFVISLLILSADLCIILMLRITPSVLLASDFCHRYSFAFFCEFLLYFQCRQVCNCLVFRGFRIIIIIIIIAVVMAFPCQNHSANSPYSFSSIYSSYQKDKRAKPGILTKSSALSEIGERWMDKEFHFFFKGLKLCVAGSMLRSW
jgi:hypothetical protein